MKNRIAFGQNRILPPFFPATHRNDFSIRRTKQNMIQPLTIRGVTIGEGIPKVIVPIVETSREAILKKAEELSSLDIQMVEWRADFYEDSLCEAETLRTLAGLRKQLGGIPLLFTFRTAQEGGVRPIDPGAYASLNGAVASSGDADVVDVEVFSGGERAKESIDAIHAAGAFVIGSNHDHHATPDREELVSRLRRIQQLGADIAKVAVMPQSKADVLTLLAATLEMYENYADRPIITMSMAPMGVLSRISGEVFGSSMTFGTVGGLSAPGQIPIGELQSCLRILHGASGDTD